MKTKTKKQKWQDRSAIVCRLCRRGYVAITGAHLIQKHHFKSDHPVEDYKRRFKIMYPCTVEVRRKITHSNILRAKQAGRHWTKLRLTETIRRREQTGKAMHQAAIRATDHALLSAAIRLFGHWNHAVSAAGLKPIRFVALPPKWPRERIIEAIRRRQRQGLPMNLYAVQAADNSLFKAARRRFGSWDAALRAAGLDPARFRRYRIWTKEKIVETIQHLRQHGNPINFKAIHDTNPWMIDAAIRRFGSWDNALRSVKLDPARIRKIRSWTKERIIDVLRRRHREGEALNPGAVNRADSSFYLTACRRFGGWDNALHAAGLDPDRFRLSTRWTNDKIVAELRDLHQRYGTVTTNIIRKHKRLLGRAVRRRFETLGHALEMAGIKKI